MSIKQLCSVMGMLLISQFVFAMDTLTLFVNTNSHSFVVKLPANPTTGFQWTLKNYDTSVLSLKNSQYVAPKTKLMGAGGDMLFTFEKVKGKVYPKSTLMQFSYSRSWEPRGESLKQVLINFKPS